MAPMMRLAETSWLSLLVASLSVAFAWRIWAEVRRRMLYDLHKIPGPRPLPLIGNLLEVVGTDMYHKVREIGLYNCVVGTFLQQVSIHKEFGTPSVP